MKTHKYVDERLPCIRIFLTLSMGRYLASIQTGVLILQRRSDEHVDFRTYFPCSIIIAESDYHAGDEGRTSTASNVDFAMPIVPSAFTT